MKHFLISLFILLSSLFFTTHVHAQTSVELYGVFERSVTNTKTYANPFDFTVIELQTQFTSPTGKQYNFFGFYDGDGIGGQTGNVWKFRFMPDEVGTWNYTYTWTDGTTGASGSFDVVDTGKYKGPLKGASDNSWYFEDARGNPFHWRGYDMHIMARYSPTRSIVSDITWIKNQIKTKAVDRGYNFTMIDGLIGRVTKETNLWNESYWENTTNTKRFNTSAWKAWENALDYAKENNVYVINFAGMIYQGNNYAFTDFKIFLRYWVARHASFYNYFGWSPTWEWTDIWTAEQVDQIMNEVYTYDPYKRLLSPHDCSHSTFTPWLGFTMRQAQSRNVFNGNSRIAGQQQGVCDGVVGGTNKIFVNNPIIGSEDIWEQMSGSNGQPRNGEEVRRAAWGALLAGVLPLYSEWNGSDPYPGTGQGEPEVRRMFDFFYSKTTYRKYQQLNTLVSSTAQQIASGIPGEEYLVYDQDGGSITINLSGTTTTFTVLWYDPKTGVEQTAGTVTGGSSQTLTSPFSADSVLLLSSDTVYPTSTPGPTTPPTPTSTLAPTNTPVPGTILSNLIVTSGRLYQIQTNFQVGSIQYSDRTFTYSSIPLYLLGANFIKTANDDKGLTGDSFLTFSLSQPATVYVAHDDRITSKPSWLFPFTDSGDNITSGGGTFSLFSKSYTAGTVTLGGNAGGSNSMYSVIVVPQDENKPGDTDSDGDIDIFDYNTVLSNFGQSVSGANNGDLDNDGDVDIFDYNLVISNFGR